MAIGSWARNKTNTILRKIDWNAIFAVRKSYGSSVSERCWHDEVQHGTEANENVPLE